MDHPVVSKSVGYPKLVAADEPVSPEEEVPPERGAADVAPQAAHVAQRAGPGRHRLVPPRHDGLAAGAALAAAGGVGGGVGGLVSGLVSGVRQVNRESSILENHIA